MMKSVKSFLFLIILLALAASSLQYSYRFVKEEPLKGFYSLKEKPWLKSFTWKTWISGEFQQKISDGITDHTGFYNTFIRINNQADYSLFRLIHAKGFVQGRDRWLYEEDYLHEYNGDYFIGKAVIDKKLARLRNVQDSLRAHQIPLILVYEPGKASFVPEYIPGRFHPERRTQTNYDYFIRRSGELGITCLDMNKYFLEMKDTSGYPLFPRYGMHWSLYGVTFAVDTLCRKIESETGQPLPRFKTQQLISSASPRGTDNDIGELLNLICPLPGTPGVYPEIAWENAPPKQLLAALVIADSYYLNIVEDYGTKLFRSQEYWYYNRKLYPYQNNNPPAYVDKSNMREKLKSFDVILLMVSEINLHCGFWNFADEAWAAFHPEHKDSHLYRIGNDIRNDREWFSFMVGKSQRQNTSLEEMILTDASYVFYSNFNALENKTAVDTIEYIVLNIRNSPEWLALVEKKAQEQQVPLDTMLMRDAVYTYLQSKKKP
jgi:hypothetical protein